MRMILDFFEYTLDGFLFWVYFILMLIFSLACLGVVGDKVSKKKHAELIAKREALAKEEYKKAQELIDKQAHSYGVDNTLDPTAKKAAEENNNVVSQQVQTQQAPEVEVKEPAVVVLDAPVSEGESVVDNLTPIVDNTSEEAVKEEEVPAVLVINDDGTSNS